MSTRRGSTQRSIHPRSQTSPSSASTARSLATKASAAISQKPLGSSQPKNGSSARGCSRGSGDTGVSARGAALESAAPSTPRSRLSAASGGEGSQRIEHATLWDNAAEDWDCMGRQSFEDDGDFDGAGASVLDALSAEERRLTSELKGLSAEEKKVSSRGVTSKNTQAGHNRSQQQPPPMVRGSDVSNRRHLQDVCESPLTSRSDWIADPGVPKAAHVSESPAQRKPQGRTGAAIPKGKFLPATPDVVPSGHSLFHDQGTLPWEQNRGATTRSNSSTSIGSASISSRRLYSDVSSVAFSARPGSDCGSASTCAVKRTPPTTAPRSSNPSGGSRKTSALDIANRCWQEFEGALRN